MRSWFFLLLLLGCASTGVELADEQGYRWICDLPPIPEDRCPVREIGNGDIYLYCGLEEKALSCTRRDGDRCEIFIDPDGPAWLLPHELRHRDGCRHPTNELTL